MLERTKRKLGKAGILGLAVAIIAFYIAAQPAVAKPSGGTRDDDGIQIYWDVKTNTITVNWKAQSGSGVSKVTVYIAVYHDSIAESWKSFDHVYGTPYLKTQTGVDTWLNAPAVKGDTIWVRVIVYGPKSTSPVSDKTDTLVV